MFTRVLIIGPKIDSRIDFKGVDIKGPKNRWDTRYFCSNEWGTRVGIHWTKQRINKIKS